MERVFKLKASGNAVEIENVGAQWEVQVREQDMLGATRFLRLVAYNEKTRADLADVLEAAARELRKP